MSKTVLLASGNKTLVMYIGVLLKRMGFGIVFAGTCIEALSLITIVQPDALVVDSEIPGFDVLEGLERVKPDGPTVVPVVMLVGTPDDETERRCKMVGASSIVSKPIHVEDLHHALQWCMYNRAGAIRRHVRAKAGVRVSVAHEGGEMDLMTESLSAGGAFIRHESPLSVGTVVDVFLPLGDEECLFLTGRVIYNQKPCQNAFGLCPGFAVEFVGPTPEEAGAIREFVNRYMTEDIQYMDGSPMEHADYEMPAEGTGAYAAIQSYTRRNGMADERAV